MNEITMVEPAPAFDQNALMLNPANMAGLMTFADMMAKAVATVPQHLVGKPADCLAIAMQAMRWGMDPFVVSQKTHIVSGRLGYEAQLVNAVVMSSGAIRGTFRYEYRGAGQDLECRVGAVPAGQEDVLWGEWLRNGDVAVRNSPLWKTNVKQQLGYLQVKNWARLYTPGAILGVYTHDELADADGVIAEPVRRGPQRKSAAEAKPVEMVQEVPQAEQQRSRTKAEREPEKPAVERPQPRVAEHAEAPSTPQRPAQGNGGPIVSPGQVAYLRNKLRAAEIEEVSICTRFEVADLEHLPVDLFDLVKAELLALV